LVRALGRLDADGNSSRTEAPVRAEIRPRSPRGRWWAAPTFARAGSRRSRPAGVGAVAGFANNTQDRSSTACSSGVRSGRRRDVRKRLSAANASAWPADRRRHLDEDGHRSRFARVNRVIAARSKRHAWLTVRGESTDSKTSADVGHRSQNKNSVLVAVGKAAARRGWATGPPTPTW
jgi:hypothetical protein